MKTSIRRFLSCIARAAVEATYPKVCAGCGLRGVWLCELCDECVPSLAVVPPCRRCGVPRIDGRCGCAALHPAIYRARSAHAYDGWAAASVKRLKYEGEPGRAEHLGLLMVPLLSDLGPVDGLVPVPLHPSRERTRGYNQAALLAEEMGRHTGVPVVPMLQRTVATVSQTSLSGDERKKNVEGVFAVDPSWSPIPGKRFVLVDDVRTTGSTLGACTVELQKVRPATIGVVTFALDMQRGRLEALRELAAARTPSSP